MSAEKIISNWKKKIFKPVYWLEGEEDYYIDQVVSYAEHEILPESEASFNLTVFYGKDAQWAEVINACRRYPMFAERQVVLLKEAQHMRDIDKLEPYIENPLASTIFVVSHKEKKVDGRSKLSKLLKNHAEVLSTQKMRDSNLPEWTQDLVTEKGYTISQKGLMLLVNHIGNDLNRISHEIDKLVVNLGSRHSITEDDIETYVGVSKEYNVFELQEALARKDIGRALTIIQYFEGNPKAGPIQMILPTLYNFFSKTYMVYGLGGMDDKTMAAAMGVNPYFLKDYKLASRQYSFQDVEQVLLLLHEYNLRSIGIHDIGTEDASLMKEMVMKMVWS
jgi:DNA polymerase-3 subunit delta